MSRIRRILCATDLSTASRKAVDTAFDLAQSTNASLVILHVIVAPVPAIPELYVQATVWDDLEARTRKWAKETLAQLAEKAKKQGLRATTMLVEGDPARHILRLARSSDLIAMGTHGRSGFKKLILGSVASQVIAAAPCPVVTVRSK